MMAAASSLETNTSVSRHLIAAAIAAATLLIVTVAALVFSTFTLGSQPYFLPSVGCMTLLSDFLTGVLLLANAIVMKDRIPLRLAAAYLFSFLMLTVHLAAFPGGLSPQSLIGNTVSAAWLWCFWQAGFAILVISFAFGKISPLRSGEVPLTIIALLGATLILTVVAIEGLPVLPVLLENKRYTRFMTFGIAPVLLALFVMALASVIVKRRMRDAVTIWLSLAMVISALDIVLVFAGGERYSLGWYMAKLLNLVVGVAVLVALLSDFISQSRETLLTNQRLKDLITTDPLTGIGNRLALDREIVIEWKRARREHTALSMLMIDIDFFKSFNDRYGHPAGDRCIEAVGATVGRQARRPADLAARLGGEEFVVLLPNTEETGASQVAERMLIAISSLGMSHADNPTGQVTVSVGVATCRPSDLAGEVGQLMEAADQALYQAKSGGRNRIRASAAIGPEQQDRGIASDPSSEI